VTKARSSVLAVLEAAKSPLSAADVLSLIDPRCDQATVYRALHYLEECERAESFVLHCDEHGVERYYASSGSAHRHWFHCESCHRFTDLGACEMSGFLSEVERERGLTVSRHTFYLSGICAACGKKTRR
jgi:Fur family ferric uptake transcriptional regulator